MTSWFWMPILLLGGAFCCLLPCALLAAWAALPPKRE